VVAAEAKANAGVPTSVVDMAKQRKRLNAEQVSTEKDSNISFDSVWVTFDVDEHTRVEDAKIVARDNEIGVAVSKASGKSTVLQALVLIHQTIIDHEWSTRLRLPRFTFGSTSYWLGRRFLRRTWGPRSQADDWLTPQPSLTRSLCPLQSA